MSELDQLYQEFYTQVTAKIWAEYEVFKKEKPYLIHEEQIRQFKESIKKSILSIKDFPELNPLRTSPIGEEGIMYGFIEHFRNERKKYRYDAVLHYFKEHEKKLLEVFPTFESTQSLKEIITKFFASKDALNDFIKDTKIDTLDQKNSLTTMSAKQTLRQWLANGENDRVVEALLRIAEQSNDKYFSNDALQVAGRFNSLQRDYKNGILDAGFYNIQLNNIRQTLQSLIDKVPANAKLPDVAMDAPVPTLLGNEGNDTTTQTQKPPAEDSKKQPADKNANIPWIVGLVLILFIIALIVFIPNPKEEQFFVFRIVLALAAAGLASVIPGILKVNWGTGVTAGGAIAMFLIVFFFNPKALDKPKQPFDLTIFVESPSERIEFEAPAKLSLRLYNDPRTETIGENKTAIFKLIPAELEDSMAIVELIAAGWQFTNGSMRDTVTISKKSAIVQIERDNSRCCVSGFVEDESGKPAPQVTISILDIFTETDARGRFKLEIPKAKQRKDQSLKVYKKGYQSKTYPVQPETQQELEIQLEKVKK